MADELAVQEIAKQSGGVLGKAYDDLIHPSAEPLGTMMSYLPRTIRLFFSRWEKWLINSEESLSMTAELLREKVEKIPEENLCEPEPWVAVPAIQQIAYCYDSEELRDLYANLLASSMNSEKKWQVHPGYVDIIKQLTPDEAKFLRLFPRSSSHYLPVVDLEISLGKGRSERVLKRNYTNLAENVCDSPESISIYIDDLIRLKLIDIPSLKELSDREYYDGIVNSDYIKKLKETTILKEDQKFKFKYKVMHLTDYGLGFIQCCVSDEYRIVVNIVKE